MGLVPTFDSAHPRDFFLLVANDDDFITQHGFQTVAPYADASGVELDTMLLVYRVRLPETPQCLRGARVGMRAGSKPDVSSRYRRAVAIAASPDHVRPPRDRCW